MAHTRGGHTDSSLTRDSISQAPEAASIPPSKGRVPSGPPQRRYETRRPPTTPGATSSRPESSARRTLAKRARTLAPRESSKPSQSDPKAPTNSQIPSGMSPEAIIKRPMVTAPPTEGNSDYRARSFHSELSYGDSS